MQDAAVIDNQVVSNNMLGLGSSEKKTTASFLPDWLGMLASIGCAIHCAAMPFVIAFLPMLGLSFLADAAFHKLMVGVCLALALAAFIPGWRSHRRWLPAAFAVAGLSVISFGAFALEDSCACCSVNQTTLSSVAVEQVSASTCTDEHCEHCAKANQNAGSDHFEKSAETIEAPEPLMAGIVPWVTPFGGLLLICAHVINRRFVCCSSCHSAESAAG